MERLVLDGEIDVDMVKQRLTVLMQKRARRHWSALRHRLVTRCVGFYWMELPARNTTREYDRQQAVRTWSSFF